MSKPTNGYGRALSIATAIGSIVVIGFTLGMCPKISEIQTTIEAADDHNRIAQAAQVQHDRIDAVFVTHKQSIELQRAELQEYRRAQEQNRELIHETQKQILRELRKAR